MKSKSTISTPPHLDGEAPARPMPAQAILIDAMAIGDAQVDYNAGDDACYQLMEHLFAGGDLAVTAWERYHQVYAKLVALLGEPALIMERAAG